MSTPRLAFLVTVSALLLVPACGDTDTPGPSSGGAEAIAFQAGEQPFGGFAFSTGQPDEARLRDLAPKLAGVVSFQMPGENTAYDEAAVVAEAGGTFTSIPVSKATLQDATERKKAYAAFEAAAKEPSKMTWFHCKSGNRVGALWALYRAEVEKQSIEDAIADGKTAGLTKLEPLVREILGAK